MTTWLVFLKGATDEFVLPVVAPRREDALKAAASAYPSNDYSVLTSYAEEELQGILREAQAWQGDVPAETAGGRVETPVKEALATLPTPSAPQAAALTSVRKQSLQKKRPAASAAPAPVEPDAVTEPLPAPATVAAPRVDEPVTAPAASQPMPQDLKTLLALLKASATPTGETTQPPVQLEGRVETTTGAPVATVPLGTVFESRPVRSPAPSPAISRRPMTEAMPTPQARSMAEVLKSLRK